jgi:hypothetical protein
MRQPHEVAAVRELQVARRVGAVVDAGGRDARSGPPLDLLHLEGSAASRARGSLLRLRRFAYGAGRAFARRSRLMGKWTRAELEEAFENYQRLALEAGTTGSWDKWAEQFTVDATYIEHLYGTLGGREAIHRWISHTMSQPINRDMRFFPVEWYMIDEERGWVVAQVWNRMIDPGDGSLHQAYNFTLLKYAGDMKWSYEEDIYNPAHFRDMIRGWMEKKKALEGKQGAA